MRAPAVNLPQRQFARGKLAITIAAAFSSFAFQAVAADSADTAKNGDTITVVGSTPVAQESAWGPTATIAAKHSATATKTDTPLVKTPQSVSVVTRQEMDMRQPDTVKQALNMTPGVFASRGSSSTYDFIAIRGITPTGINQYLDGIKLQGDFYSEASIDPYMLERVEVLRGPASVLYGKSSPGGVVSMVSKRPTTEPLKEVQFKMGSDNLFQTGFDFSDAIDDAGVYSYRLTGLARSADSQQLLAKEKRYAIAPSFSWRPDDKTNFTFLSNFQNDPQTGFYGWTPRQGSVVPYVDANGNSHKLSTNFTDSDTGQKYSRNQKMVGYSFDHSFNDTWSVHQNLRYTKISGYDLGVYNTGFVSPGVLGRGSLSSIENLNNFDVDTQAQAKFNTAGIDHTLLVGLDYMRMRNDVNAEYGTASNLNLLNPQYGNPNVVGTFAYNILDRQEQTGAYLQEQAEWNKWVLTAGGRFDYAKTSTFDRNANTLAVNNNHQFTWRGGLNYLFDNGISPYFSYSQSFEPQTGADINAKPFDPAHGEQYEAGVKYIPKDRPISLTAAVFNLTENNLKTTDPTNPAFSIQTGKIRSRGVELEAKAAVNANVNLIASYTYTDAQYIQDYNWQGKQPVEVPRHMASLWADYTFHETELSGLTLGSGVRYIGSSSSFYADGPQINQTFSVASYALVDATLKYDLARFGMPGSSIGLNVNNLLNRQYVSSCYSSNACYWGAEREVVATATFRF
ncbi:ferrichrome porin FhuA [Rouxiella sp. Mn2063]|uniref:ferrichrome porin FhuA n=1 Tax=Rouxiella sp. Mn2063 TaxID=3395262 RepID=UPI003BBA62E3